jgi:hypothetical protein
MARQGVPRTVVSYIGLYDGFGNSLWNAIQPSWVLDHELYNKIRLRNLVWKLTKNTLGEKRVYGVKGDVLLDKGHDLVEISSHLELNIAIVVVVWASPDVAIGFKLLPLPKIDISNCHLGQKLQTVPIDLGQPLNSRLLLPASIRCLGNSIHCTKVFFRVPIKFLS